MTNEEIKEYMHGWVKAFETAPSKENQIMAAVIAIPVLLAEIAMRLPEVKP